MSSELPQVEATSAAMYTAVANASSGPDASSPVDSTIGILAAQFVEQSNAGVVLDGGGGGTVKALAFQQKGQSCGYYPDSVASSADKLNVRQGRYAIWGPAHLVANVGADGNPNGLHAAAVAAVLNAFIATGCEGAACPPGSNSLLGASETYFGVDGGTSGPTDAIKQAVIDAEAAGGVVPWCAMQVTRGNIEIGAEASYQPSEPCGCRFESQVPGATVSAYCHACVVDGDCQAEGAKASYPKCRYGFCEVQ
jgi:flavin-binding protein dodecin